MYARHGTCPGEQPVDGGAYPLHENVGRQALLGLQLVAGSLPIQVVAAPLPLGLQHKPIRLVYSFLHHCSCLWVLQVIQTPQPCIAEGHITLPAMYQLAACM